MYTREMDRDLVVVAHNIRSTHNIGSLMRTCEGFGVKKLYLSGYTPYPQAGEDDRLPHVVRKLNQQISKTALGAEKSVTWQNVKDINQLLDELKSSGYKVIALEQTDKSIELNKFKPPSKVALLLGEEVDGVDQELLKACDAAVEIPMLGKKESFNVTIAAAIALYHLRFTGT